MTLRINGPHPSALREPGPGIARPSQFAAPRRRRPEGLLKERRRPHYETWVTLSSLSLCETVSVE